MFYSHQLLARKAPLGQIWMAATMHAKIHRRKLDKLNIIKICEEILNPSVPMALRLSGILMGGVVIVYERKVKLLYEDVTRLLVEINEAWKVKSAPSDPTRLPKGKSQAKYDAVTLPPNRDEDLGDIEHPLTYSNGDTVMDFQQTSYIAMRLDDVDDPYFNKNLPGDLKQDHHQADAANITLFDNYDSYQADTTTFNRFERFDIEGDEETNLNFTQPEHTEIPSLIPSPPHEEDLHNKPEEIQEQHPEEQVKQQSDESKETNLDKIRQRLSRRRARRPAALKMDYDQNIIPGQIYQSWLQNSTDIVSKRGRKRKPMDPLSMMKIPTPMDLPSLVLVEKLVTNGNRQVHYPAALLEVWMRITQPPHDSPSGQIFFSLMLFMEPMGDPFEDYHSRVGSLSMGISIEKQRANNHNNEMLPEVLMEELKNNLRNTGSGVNEANGVSANLMATPRNSGDEIRSIPSSGSGHGFFSHSSDVNSGRSGKKRPFSASKNSGNGLEPVAEELSWQHSDPNFKLAKLSENGLTPDNDLLVETGPTQTQKHQIINQPLDQITDSIRMHLKAHFDTPGSAKVESLNQLALGMNKKSAACLFYQTCVLATRDYIRVKQNVPYGDILISRGAKM
ncbi:Sister chromatid cohesion complex Cohesin, subunit RAD21/SCC1 [Handroanthus impetiginosus]|uniref:Sister chromatid cohesion complex Cohesin, subunit RAD21/SCC1 n=1 Tax=Handroanthus impetiginosus TaxID=429701 RepID=A0A2G9HBB6_9LAMI|nr:Sister chromatid cohesion complex Cohesin, subunit RAD21/SCC1 [Handroanthus impetiginosus]